jgi:hypothetical protein
MKKPKPKTPPPEHLSDRSKELWVRLVPGRAHGPARLTLLQAALEALDLADAARAERLKQAMSTATKTTGAAHLNPLVKLEIEARRQFMAAWEKLRLTWDE